jgi:hypothetical protein
MPTAARGWSTPTAGPGPLRYWAGRLTGSHCALEAAAGPAGDPLPPIREASPGAAITGLMDCAGGGAELCPGGAALFAWPGAPGHDVVLAIDHQAAPHAGMFDPASPPISVTPVPALTSKIPANSALVALHVADLDGDGAVELVAAFAPGTAADRGAILVCRGSGSVPASCDDVVPAIIAAAPATHACRDAAPGRLGYRDPWTAPSPGAVPRLPRPGHDRRAGR